LFLVIGGAIVLPLAALILPAALKGRDQVIEALTAFAIAERTPLPVIAALAVVGVVCLTSALEGFVW
jgi:hypothetical protein